MALRFDGKVAIVTGAGGGLGREYALLLASRGASVVVNDLGGSRSGDGASSKMADVVVEEIRRKGGKAVGNYDSVEEGEKLVQTALDNFGRIDILINNAGILRDRSFPRTSDQDWDLLHRVHLRGAFQVTRAAWPHMKKQGYGRIVITSSVAGIYGNFGQSNYSAAKLGLVGLSNTLAIEGEKGGIHCNVILPMAASRLTEDILPPDVFELLKPELIAPVVAWLCHEECQDNGSLIEAAGGWAGKYRWQRSKGSLLIDSLQDAVTLEKVRDRWSAVTDMSNGDFHASNQGATIDLVSKMAALSTKKPKGRPAAADAGVLAAVGFVTDPLPMDVSPHELILYALGVGVSTRSPDDLRFLFEGHPDFAALPTFGVIPCNLAIAEVFMGNVPGLQFDLTKLLHGEQYTEILSPLPTSGRLSTTCTISAVLDKGSGCLVLADIMSRDEATQEPVVRNQMSLFIVGAGGFGGPRTSEHIVQPQASPDRKPDKETEQTTSIDQAALYRLSGDLNPLHIDPGFAAMGGFDRPILHGLCSYGIAVKHVMDAFAGGDPARVKAVKARFAKPVLPGQTLKTRMWKEGSRILFSCQVKETGNECLSGGWVDLTEAVGNGDQASSTALVSDRVFGEMAERLRKQPEMVSTVGAIFQWNITRDGKNATQWVMDLKTPPGAVVQGSLSNGQKADCTLTISDEDMVDMFEGKLNPQNAFMKGKLKVGGNVMLTQKLQSLIGGGTTPAKL